MEKIKVDLRDLYTIRRALEYDLKRQKEVLIACSNSIAAYEIQVEEVIREESLISAVTSYIRGIIKEGK